MKTPAAFLSHSGIDAAAAGQLARDLRGQGVDVWYAEWEIKPGDSLRRKIDEGIDRATHFLVLLTPASLKSEWVQTELDAGLVRKISGACRLIPILSGIAADEVPATLRGLKWVQLEPYEGGLRQFVEVCHDVSIKPPLGAPPPWAIGSPLGALGLSTAAQRVAAWINSHSTDGTAYDVFDRDVLMRELALTAEQAGMAASELSDAGYVKLIVDSGSGPAGFSNVLPTPLLFFRTDPVLQGWDPSSYFSPLSRRTMLRIAAFASNVVPSTRIVAPFTRPAWPRRSSTQENTSRCVSTSINRRVREIVEWSGPRSSTPRLRKLRTASESAARHAIPRSESSPSKYPSNSSRK